MAIKTVATNRKAFHNYHIQDSLEAGIVLTGTEIKSIRDGRINLGDAYVRVEKGELWLVNVHIARYEAAGISSHEPRRPRKLLLHRKQIEGLIGKMQERGFTLVPLKIYFNNKDLAKIELALARGKRQYDKRQAITERGQKRDVDRSIKKYRK